MKTFKITTEEVFEAIEAYWGQKKTKKKVRVVVPTGDKLYNFFYQLVEGGGAADVECEVED